ncbi:hypothetical protein D3C73_1362000 [compost metagenome]
MIIKTQLISRLFSQCSDRLPDREHMLIRKLGDSLLHTNFPIESLSKPALTGVISPVAGIVDVYGPFAC